MGNLGLVGVPVSDELRAEDRKRLVRLCETAVKRFDESDWQILGAHTGFLEFINNHGRLLRSYRFNDPDYEGHVHYVLFELVRRDSENLEIIESYIANKYDEGGERVSTAGGQGRSIRFTPNVFEVPEGGVDTDMIAVMMPFAPQFEPVFGAIRDAAATAGFKAQRAKDIWEHSTIIQDVFGLIFRSYIVVCDFTGKNSNVFYEAGIAHTLGKHVVPITQSLSDVPFDLQHHRCQAYLDNVEGRSALKDALTTRFRSLATDSAAFPRPRSMRSSGSA